MNNVTPQNDPQVGRFRLILTWIVGIVFILFAGASVFFVSYIGLNPDLWDIYVKHFQVILGLPCAAFASLFIVLVLKESGGNIEFSGLGFTFKGASGQIVLWIFVYLAIAGTIKLLW
jgi:hypothetical protein